MSNNIDQNYPQFLKADRKIKENYLNSLVDPNSGTCFASQEQGEVYLLAAAIACASGQRVPTRNKTMDIRLYEKLNPNYKILIRAMALEAYKKGGEYDYDVVLDGKKVLSAVEEYANAGLEILYKKVFDKGLDLTIEEEIWEMLSKFCVESNVKKEK